MIEVGLKLTTKDSKDTKNLLYPLAADERDSMPA
jgi:hypothetical protein